MRPICADPWKSVLAEVARRKSVLVFDYDGTLAPQGRPMRSTTRNLLEGLARLFPCAVISGRGVDELARLCAGVNFACLVGDHGGDFFDTPEEAAKVRRRVRGWLRSLTEELGDVPGAVLEDRFHALAVHYRQARSPQRALRSILHAVEGLPRARLRARRGVVEVLPAGAPDKGAALDGICRMFHAEIALYVGDDASDEDAFALRRQRRIVGVRVERGRASQAGYHLADQAELDVLLRALLACRQAGCG